MATIRDGATPSGHILVQKQDGVLTITLNRPEKLNAYTGQMGREIAELVRAADLDDEVRVIIFTGAGRAFCAGADISAGSDSFGASAEVTFGEGGEPGDDTRFIEALYRCTKPSIAAINGPAVGLGFTLPLAMDIRVAVKGAKFGPVFSRRGLLPEAGSAWFLPKIVGLSQAMRWCYSGKLFGADEALKAGLVSEVVEPEDLIPFVNGIAAEIVQETSAISIAGMRQMFLRFSGADSPLDLLKLEGPLNRALGAGSDVAEGVAAFMEKRRPNFPGKVSKDLPPEVATWLRQEG